MVLAKKPSLLAGEGPRADLAAQEGRMATCEAAGESSAVHPSHQARGGDGRGLARPGPAPKDGCLSDEAGRTAPGAVA